MHISDQLSVYLPEEGSEMDGFPMSASNFSESDKVFILKYYLDKIYADGELGVTWYINEKFPLHEDDILSEEIRTLLEFWNQQLEEDEIMHSHEFQLLLARKNEDKYVLIVEKNTNGYPDFSMPEIKMNTQELRQLLRIYPRVSVYNYNMDYIWEN